ncbi:insulinase family protein [Allohahella sp. A8]|uniref:insulinase family protein n=1 Tax=Allohahella sp. A8 TaxID=3141461 RepID=UPI003A7FE38E
MRIFAESARARSAKAKTFAPRLTILPVTIFTMLLLSACSALPGGSTTAGDGAASDSPHEQRTDMIKKSPNDSREYRSLDLPNGLQVLLISDPTTDKAAAAMDVHVGSEDDPVDRQGLAHFLEHMLFLGTEKYPDADAYQKYINQHGGSHNASTSLNHTNYFFDIDKQFLAPALDRFSQQFTAPLFTAEYVEREKNAVNSEYSAKLKDDGRRFFGVLKEAINQSHPMSKFAVGSLATLEDREGSSIRDELLKFYAEHYRADQMRLVVLGSEPLDELEAMVKPLFEPVPAKPSLEHLTASNEAGLSPDTPPLEGPVVGRLEQRFLTESEIPALVRIEPFRERRSLTLLFDVPSTLPHYQTKPLYYLTYLIGHEGEGSLLSALKARQLAEGLSAGIFINTDQRALLSISVNLTKQGVDQHDAVIAGVFDYVDLIREKGIEAWRFEEQQRMMELAFKFQEKSAPIHIVSSLAGRLHDFDPAIVLSAPYTLDKFDAELIQSYADQIVPENMLALLTAPDQKGLDKVEQWYQVPYSLQRLSKADLSQYGSEGGKVAQSDERSAISELLALPDHNSFIPDRLDLLAEADSEKPERLIQRPGMDTWYAKDTSFGSPKASLYVSLQSPLANASVRDLVMTEMLVSLTEDKLNEYTYEAYVAGLDFKLYKHVRGLTLRIDGYSDKQYVLVEKVLNTLAGLKIDPVRFKQIKKEILRSLRNAEQSKPFERIATRSRRTLLVPAWDEKEQAAALESVSADDMRPFADKFLRKLHATILAHGNVTREQAMAASEVVQDILLKQAEPVTVEKSRIVDITDARYHAREQTQHPDWAYLYYVQGPSRSYQHRAQFGLLAQMMSTPYYNRVRTQKQMGYVVFATPFTLLEVPGLAFIVQSPSNRPAEIHAETTDFLNEFATSVESMTDADFEQHKAALITRLLEKDKTLEQRSDRYWTEIDIGNENFDTTKQIAKAVSALSKSEVLAYYQKQFIEAPEGLLFYAEPEAASATEAAAIDSDTAALPWPPADMKQLPSKELFVKQNGLFVPVE